MYAIYLKWIKLSPWLNLFPQRPTIYFYKNMDLHNVHLKNYAPHFPLPISISKLRIVLEKGNLPHPRCPLCNIMVP